MNNIPWMMNMMQLLLLLFELIPQVPQIIANLRRGKIMMKTRVARRTVTTQKATFFPGKIGPEIMMNIIKLLTLIIVTLVGSLLRSSQRIESKHANSYIFNHEKTKLEVTHTKLMMRWKVHLKKFLNTNIIF